MLTEILNDFLSIKKLEEGRVLVNPRTFDLKDHIEVIVSEMEADCKKEQRIVFDHRGTTAFTLEPDLLKKIVINLLSNAVKFSPEAAAIEIVTLVDANSGCVSFTR